jgi:hypothetical protein
MEIHEGTATSMSQVYGEAGLTSQPVMTVMKTTY